MLTSISELSVVDPIDSKSRDQEPQEAKPDDGQKEGTFEERANENTSLGESQFRHKIAPDPKRR